MKTVIGLAGVKTSGKSTVSGMIKEILPNTLEAALADKLKNTCAQVFDLDREQFDRQDLKEVPFDAPKTLGVYDVGAILESFNIHMSKREIGSTFKVIGLGLTSPRHIAQIVGTEILRNAGDEFVHCKNIKMNENGTTIISDLRFPNEYAYFKDNKDILFLPLYISREEAEKHVTPDSHPSEKCVFEFNERCILIDNNGTLEETRQQIIEVLKDADFLIKKGAING